MPADASNSQRPAQQQQQSLGRFGAMLRNWRVQNGWTQHTASQWGREVGFRALDGGTLSKLESGKVPFPRPATFFQLADLNRRIARQDWGPIKSGALRKRVVEAKPLAHSDGEPWLEQDFWSASVGLLDAPPHLISAEMPELDQAAAAALSQQWREIFLDVIQEHDLDPTEAAASLAKALPAAHRRAFGQLLMLGVPFDVDELRDQWDGHWPVAQALSLWLQELQSGDKTQ